MTLKGALLTLFALVLGSLLLLTESGVGAFLGGSLIAIAVAAVITAAERRRHDTGIGVQR